MSAPFYTPPKRPELERPEEKLQADAPPGVLGAPEPAPEASKVEPKVGKQSRFIRWLAEKANPVTLFVSLIVIAIVTALVVSLIDQGKGIRWLFEYNTISGETIISIGAALAPILAIALAIERIIETGFDMFERATDQVAALGQIGIDGYRNIIAEQIRYQEAFNSVTRSMELETDTSKIAEMEARRDAILVKMRRTREWIDDIPSDPRYVSFKRMFSIWLGLMLGLIIAILSVDSGVFGYLNIRVPRIMDMIVTGFVIGAGSGPMHQLIGVLQGLKDTFSGLGEIAGLGSVKQQVRELQEKVN